MPNSKCPVFGNVCKKSGAQNYYDSVCRSETKSSEAAVESENESDLTDLTEPEAISSFECKTKREESTVGMEENLDNHCFNNSSMN